MSGTLYAFATGGETPRNGPYVPASLIAIVAYGAAAGLCTLRPCRLSIDRDGLNVSLTRTRLISLVRRIQRLPEPEAAVVLWRDIGVIQMKHNEQVAHRKRKPARVTTSDDIRFDATIRQSTRSWRLSPLFSKADGIDVLCSVDGVEVYLNASATTIDALLKEFAGDRYREIVVDRSRTAG